MSKVIESVPESISRADYNRLIESVGFDAMSLQSLEFGARGIRARVFELTVGGELIHTPTDEDEFACAMHEVFIPILDAEAKA